MNIRSVRSNAKYILLGPGSPKHTYIIIDSIVKLTMIATIKQYIVLLENLILVLNLAAMGITKNEYNNAEDCILNRLKIQSIRVKLLKRLLLS